MPSTNLTSMSATTLFPGRHQLQVLNILKSLSSFSVPSLSCFGSGFFSSRSRSRLCWFRLGVLVSSCLILVSASPLMAATPRPPPFARHRPKTRISSGHHSSSTTTHNPLVAPDDINFKSSISSSLLQDSQSPLCLVLVLGFSRLGLGLGLGVGFALVLVLVLVLVSSQSQDSNIIWPPL
ncbi:hypothetical protein B0H21DRAFT_249870 [Amylocystis lapponica]|nr:hypothetical protein B0H21DRAFT_249870 [Amylocystis lapponica]